MNNINFTITPSGDFIVNDLRVLALDYELMLANCTAEHLAEALKDPNYTKALMYKEALDNIQETQRENNDKTCCQTTR